MAKQIRTVGDVRDERAWADARDVARERRTYLRFLRSAHAIAIRNGWVEMAARYAARIERAQVQS